VGQTTFPKKEINVKTLCVSGALLSAAVISLLTPLFALAAGTTNVVLEWNDIALRAGAAAKIIAPTESHDIALVQAAVYDAYSLTSTSRADRPFLVSLKSPAGASPDAAAVAAAHAVLVGLYPEQRAALDADLRASLDRLGTGKATDDGVAVGVEVAKRIVAMRRLDLPSPPTSPYAPGNKAGDWQPTAPQFKPALMPQLAHTSTWLFVAPDSLRPGPPPALDSAVYLRDLAEVTSIGGDASTARSPDQTQAAIYWQWVGPQYPNEAAVQLAKAHGLSAAEDARLLAGLNFAIADALTVAWDAKYAYNFWRPITAIRAGGTTAWSSEIETPPFPEYIAAHSIVAGSSAAVLEAWFGVGPNPMAFESPTLPGVTRHFEDIEQWDQEISNARIWGGVHFRNSCEVGDTIGRRLGAIAISRFMP
jgi:hypothetical protein